MAKIQGLTLKIGGDTTGLEKALNSVNKEVRSTQKQLKDVEKLLKLDPKNTELLAQKQKLLADNVQSTEKKLNQLKEAKKKFDETASETDKQSEGYMALSREILATEQALNKAKAEASGFSVNMAKAEASLNNFSKGAEKVSQATKGLSMVGGAVVGGLVSMGVNSIKTADELNTLAKQTGLTTEEIQKFQYASDIVDVSVSDITGSLKKLKSNMTGQADTWARLGISTTDASGNMRNANDVFYETLEALSKIENETERDQIAMQLLGKNADSLSGIIDDGGKALREMGAEAENLGLIMNQDTIDSMNELNDKMDKIKAQFKMTFLQEGSKIMENLTPIIEKVADAFGRLAEFIGNLSGDQLETILKIASAVALISPIASIIAKITSTTSSLLPILQSIMNVIIANPVIAIVTGIGIAIALLVATIVKHWDEIKAVLGTIANWIKEKIITPITNFFRNLWEGLKNGAKGFANFFIGIANVVIRGVNKLISGINSISFDVPKWVPLVGGKHFGLNMKKLGEIPMLANGGIVSNGGTAIVGERGAELLSVVNGQAVVRPLTNGQSSGAITINMNNTFNGYTSSQGASMSRDLTRQINIALGRA